MLRLIITGGQTGADQAGWRAARACGLETGGWMPRGFLTEDGPRPEFRELYGAREMPTDSYKARTVANVNEADATIWFGAMPSRGFAATHDAANEKDWGRNFLIVYHGARPSGVRAWLAERRAEVLNVAGSRASKAPPGFGDRVEAFLTRVFRDAKA